LYLRVTKEVSALQQANHENILRVYGWSEWEGSVAVVTELMRGRNLRFLLGDDRVPLRPVLRLRICTEIATGIAYIHNIGETKRLTHGDLKPENILLTADLHCKIGDFGGARVIKRTTTRATTSTDSLRHKQQITLVYAAPERLRQISCRPKKEQDTYSYGLIVHGVLSREGPDDFCADERRFVKAILRGERPDCQTIDEQEETLVEPDREIYQVLRSLMERCWQDLPSDRPEMFRVRDDLQSLMEKPTMSSVTQAVTAAQKKLRLFSTPDSNNNCLTLSRFNCRTRTFRAGKQYLSKLNPSRIERLCLDPSVISHI